MTNFDFLKKFNKDAYDLSILIEEHILKSPAAVKTYATSFLESIVNDMLEKTGHKIENPYVVYSMRVQKLSEFEVIDYKFKTMLLNAYKLRNTIHDEFGKIKNSEQKIALELHRKLFDIAWIYFEGFCEDYTAEYFGKPEYTPPYKLETTDDENTQTEELTLAQKTQKRLFDTCVICGKPNNMLESNLCRRCDNKVDNVENLLNMRNNLENIESFKKQDVMDLGYSKAYTNQLLHELIDEDIIKKSNDKVYFLKEDNFNKFIDEIREYIEVDLLLSEFATGKFKFNQIKNTDEYKNGLEGIYPFEEFTKIVNDIIFREFLKEIKLNIPVDEIIKDTDIEVEDVNKWYNYKKEEYIKGIRNDDFIQYNKILMDKYLTLRRQAKTRLEIWDELKINENYLLFWKNSMRLDSAEFFKEIEKIQMELFLDAIYDNKTKEDAIEIADISQEELDEMCELGREGADEYKTFYEIFEREYLNKRRKEFLYALNDNNLEKSIEKSKLSRKDYEKWYDEGEKQFLRDKITDKLTYEFYIEVTEKLMKKYVEYRIDAKTKETAAQNIGKIEKDIDDWLKLTDYEMFKNFKDELYNATSKILITGIKKGLTKKEASKLADITPKKMDSYLKRGMEGDKAFEELYVAYLNSFIPKELETFLRIIRKKNDKKKAIKATSLTVNDLDEYYDCGLRGDEKFAEFAMDYQDYKVEAFITQILKGRSWVHAIRNADLTDYDLEILGDSLDEQLLERQLDIVFNEILNDKSTKDAAKKANVSIETVYDWYIKGYEGDEFFEEFSEMYYDSYIEVGSEYVDELASEGIPMKSILKGNKNDFTKEDIDFWRKLGLLKEEYVVNITPGHDEDEDEDENVEVRWI